jgi:hypothetical protein
MNYQSRNLHATTSPQTPLGFLPLLQVRPMDGSAANINVRTIRYSYLAMIHGRVSDEVIRIRRACKRCLRSCRRQRRGRLRPPPPRGHPLRPKLHHGVLRTHHCLTLFKLCLPRALEPILRLCPQFQLPTYSPGSSPRHRPLSPLRHLCPHRPVSSTQDQSNHGRHSRRRMRSLTLPEHLLRSRLSSRPWRTYEAILCSRRFHM